MNPQQRFEVLVGPVLADLYRFALRLTRDPVRAEDLLQQSLERGISRLHQLEDDGAFRVWQSRVIYTTWQNQRARRTDMLVVPDELERKVVPLGTGAERPDRRLTAREVGHHLARAMDALPLEQREAVWLVDAQGHTYAETADILGIAPGTAASRVARGRLALRVALKQVALEQGVGR